MATVIVLAGLAAWPSGAGAVITVGSDLSDTPLVTGTNCAPAAAPCTFLQLSVNEGNPYPVKSPASGTVTSFRIRSGSADTVTFRLGRYAKDMHSATGAGTGPKVTLPGAGTYTFPASVPIQNGDYVGFDSSFTRAFQSLPCTGLGANYFFNPVLVDGGPFAAVDANSICELMVQAVIVPSSVFTLGKLALKVKKAGAFLTVNAPGPGTLTLKGKGVAARSAGGDAVASKRVEQAGKVTLKIKPRGKTKRKLAAGHSARVKVKITYSPTGGTPSTLKRTLKLKP